VIKMSDLTEISGYLSEMYDQETGGENGIDHTRTSSGKYVPTYSKRMKVSKSYTQQKSTSSHNRSYVCHVLPCVYPHYSTRI